MEVEFMKRFDAEISIHSRLADFCDNMQIFTGGVTADLDQLIGKKVLLRLTRKNRKLYIDKLWLDEEYYGLEDGEISIEQAEGIIFRHSANYADQVTPDLDADYTKLLGYIGKHFNVQSDSERKLLALYLVEHRYWCGVVGRTVPAFLGGRTGIDSPERGRLKKGRWKRT